jgi:hypothetical protein
LWSAPASAIVDKAADRKRTGDVILFAREGAHVACIDIDKEAADNTVAQIARGGKAFTDVATPTSTRSRRRLSAAPDNSAA